MCTVRFIFVPVRLKFCAVRFIFWDVRFIFAWFVSFFAVLIFHDRFSFYLCAFILFILDLKILSVTERHRKRKEGKQSVHPQCIPGTDFRHELFATFSEKSAFLRNRHFHSYTWGYLKFLIKFTYGITFRIYSS